MKRIFLLFSHLLMLAMGFALGVYLLPILTAPPPPSSSELEAASKSALYQAEFKRDLVGSDFLHWGRGSVNLTAAAISFEGELAPGPDYQLYLTPQFVGTEAEFLALKSSARLLGPVKTFESFVVPLPAGVALDQYNTVVVWCESFGEFISAAQYR